MIHFKNGKYSKIQGVDSDKVKYKNSLCAKCNNELTQPFDKSYDIFFNYIINNYIEISKKRILNFRNIYGDNFPLKQTELFKFFIKIFGCDLVEYGFSVPTDIINLIDKSHFTTQARITLSINEDILKTEYPTQCKYGIGRLITSNENLNTKTEKDPFYIFSIELSYLTVNIFYRCITDLGLGSEWIADKQYLYIGSSDNKYMRE